MYMTNRVSPAPLMAEAKMMFMVSKMEYSATNLSSTSVSRRISGRAPPPTPLHRGPWKIPGTAT